LHEFLRGRGLDIHLAYCPERIVQGYAIRELRKLPQLISGFSDVGLRCAEELFRRLGVQTISVTVQEAELAKLFSNAWRYIQFAIANQFYMIATGQGADYDRIYHAMTCNYERAQDFPRPGFAAGPCLLKDTLQLAAFHGNNFQLGHAAMMVNEGLPNFLVNNLRQDLKLELAGLRVGILGMAFKADIDDIRDSLSYKLAKVLRFHGAEVSCSDEFVRDPVFVSKEQLVAACPVIIVGVPHSAYRELAVPPTTHLVDLWGVTRSRSEAA
jgi:UDP-N-acetyl-D-mannosaminuronic acid dehydrogenase